MTEAVIFDLDGTLLDTSSGVFAAVRYTVDAMGLPPLPESVIRKFIGPPVKQSLMKYCALDDDQATRATAIFRNRYSTVNLFGATLYNGIIDVLEALKAKGIKIGVATYKREDYAIRLLQEKSIAPFCNSMRGADDQGIKSKSDILRDCMEELGVIDPETAVLVGDTEHDSAGAQQAGVPFVGVIYGYGFREPQDIPCSPLTRGAAATPLDILQLL